VPYFGANLYWSIDEKEGSLEEEGGVKHHLFKAFIH
jgi:hypothetical protein